LYLVFTTVSACCRRAKEARLEAQLAQQEEAALMKEQQYASLDQEVKGTKLKLMRLQKKLQVLLLLLQLLQTAVTGHVRDPF
jgi:hypothetical protein